MGVLPNNFFDNNERTDDQPLKQIEDKSNLQLKKVNKTLDSSNQTSQASEKIDGSDAKQVKGALPEGFFDNKDADLRARGIEPVKVDIKYLNAIQTNAHHLLRYVATAVIVNKRRRNMLKELVKVIQQEQHSYKDPITEFLECLYVNYDFDGAQKKLKECEQVILNDPFLGKRVEDSNFATVPLRDEFLENARLFVFETYCRIHRCIDIRHEQIIEAMKNLNMRTYLLAKNIVEPAQAAQATR
ncbi:hypothetical protein BHE74_00020334 [Ensete ventricosum]|nr:hypothetical protein BHE74_00020334 [Ensete ventricosum]